MRYSRRLLPAALVACVAFAAVDLGIAAVVAQTAEGNAVEAEAENVTGPFGFVVPAVRFGDRAVYEQTFVGPYRESARTLGLSWTPGEPMRLPDGRELDTEVLDAFVAQRDGEASSDVHRIWFDGGSATVVARGLVGETAGSSSSSVDPIPLQQSGGHSYVYEFLEYDGPGETCLLAGRWTGRVIGDNSSFDIPACAGHDLELPAGMTLTLNATVAIEGRAAAWLVGGLEGRQLEVLMGEGIPYPLEIVHSWTGSGGAYVDRSFLTGFAAGDRLRTGMPSDRQPDEPMPDVLPAPISGRLLVDDTGLDLSFLLSEAYAAAGPHIQTFLQDHPDAIVTWAWMQNEVFGDSQRVRWTFTLADAEDGLQVAVTRPVYPADVPRALANALPAAVTTSGDYPHEGEISPLSTPPVADFVAAYAWFTGHDVDCYGYSLDYRGFTVTVGRCLGTDRSGPTISPPGFGFGGEWMDESMYFDETGRATGGQSSTVALSNGAAATPPFLPPPDNPPAKATFLDAAFSPTMAQLAAAGSVAVGLGVLLVLWPLLKGLPGLGLFTRLREPDLLRQPTRARIHALIESSPGIHFGQLQRRANVANGTLVHHLRALRTGGLVVAKENGNYTSYFVRGDRPTAATLSLRSEGARLVWASVQAIPGISNAGLAERTSLTASTVSYHLRSLERNGLVRIERTGARLRVFRADA